MKASTSHILKILSLLPLVACNVVISAETPAELQPYNQPNFQSNPKLMRAKRMYALCPPEFQKIGNDCFYISAKKESWLDAHFDCKDRNSKLAEPLKFADKRLRKYLMKKYGKESSEKWIGGMYNWHRMQWQWGYNGGDMKYQAFDDSAKTTNLQFHCTVMDPSAEYKWIPMQCTRQNNFICQHTMSFVNEKNRVKVYAKWNETYPNQLANEVPVYVSTNGNNNRRNNLNRKRNRLNSNRVNQVNNNDKTLKKSEDLSTSAPDYLPYNVYSKLETFEQKPQESIAPIHVEQPSPSLKQRKRHSKPLKLTGDVDLGKNIFKHQRKQKPKKTVVASNKNDEIITDSGRHHHHSNNNHNHPNNALPEAELKIQDETTQSESIIPAEVDTSVATKATTAVPEIVQKPTSSEQKKKLEEKALRRERLKAKLAQLSPEERQAFLLMKQQRADARKKGLNFSSSTS